MMESLVSNRSRGTVNHRQSGLQPCPHCGGNVRLIKDVYGAYHQCLQCSREIQPAVLAIPAEQTPAISAAGTHGQELMAA